MLTSSIFIYSLYSHSNIVSELAGEGAMPPQLPTPARRLLEIAELRVCLRRQIRSGSLLRRGVTKLKEQYFDPSIGAVRLVQPIRRGSLVRRQNINPATRFSYSHSPLKSSAIKTMTRNSDLQLSDSELNFFVNVGNEVADASHEWWILLCVNSNESIISSMSSVNVLWDPSLDPFHCKEGNEILGSMVSKDQCGREE
nr:bifunctional phosphatase IMPL2, chloroplastic [Ipomoea batatas]